MPADVIDYRLIGDDLQAVIVTLDPGEGVIAEAGAMMYMEDGIEMATTLDPTGAGGGLMGKLLGAGKRMLTGESFFITLFANGAARRRDVAFSSPYPGKIQPIDLKDWGGTLIAQKDAFLCGARGIDVSIALNRRIGAGFFGGEGFILQKLTGDGLAFLHASGTLHPIDLGRGEMLRVDTGCLVAFQPSVDYDIEMVKGVKTALFGGEGLFFVRLTGPGRVILQTLPFSRLADRIIAAAPRAGGGRREEGGILGALGGVLDGDSLSTLGATDVGQHALERRGIDPAAIERMGRDLAAIHGQQQLAPRLADLPRERADALDARGIGRDVPDVDPEDARRIAGNDLAIDLRILLPGIADQQERERRVQLDDALDRLELVGPV